MRKKQVAAVAIAGLASSVWGFGLGACSLRDLSGYSSGGPEDGGELLTEGGGGSEGGGDGAPHDAPATDGPAGGGFRCSDHPRAIVCATFDESVFGAGFTPQGEGTLEESTTLFETAPRALKASLPSRGPSAPKAFFQRALPTSLRSFSIGWDVRIEADADQQGIDLCGFFRSDPYYTLTIRFRKSGGTTLELLEIGNPTEAGAQSIQFTPLTGSLRPTGFTRIEIRVTGDDAASSAAVFIDAKPAGTASLVAHRYASAPYVAAGIESSDGAGGPVSVYVDNLLVEPLP